MGVDDDIQLELGDIIMTKSAQNNVLNNQTFYVSYVDLNSHTTWVNTETFEKLTLKLNGGKFDASDGVDEITLLSRSTEKGFAKQNNLLLGTWLDIEFGGDSPLMITGLITDLEEDMIEITNYALCGEKMFIDFAYKGIPEELPIKNICIRGKPISLQEPNTEEDLDENEKTENPGPVFNNDGSLFIYLPENPQTEETYRERLLGLARNEKYPDEDDDHRVAYISRKIQKYQIEAQLNDLYNELLARIPDHNRTHRSLQATETHIRRFQELRDEFSLKDGVHIIGRRPRRDARFHKPLGDSLINLDVRIPWVTHVVSQKRKLYDQYRMEERHILPNDVINIQLGDILKSENISRETLFYKNANGQTDFVINYARMERVALTYLTPFEEFQSDYFSSSFKLSPKIDMDTVVANFHEFQSTFSTSATGNMNKPKMGSFGIQRYNQAIHYYPEVRKKVTEKTILMPEDEMNVHSFLFMPTEYVLYGLSPGSSIYEKSNDRHLYKFNTLRDNNVVLFESDLLFPCDKKVQHLIMHDETEDASTDEDKLFLKNKLIKSVKTKLPNIFEVIDFYQQKNLNTYSVQKFIKVLEPFLFYYGDLTDASLRKLRYFLMKNQKAYFERQLLKKKAYQQLQKETYPTLNYSDDQNLTINTLNHIFVEPQLRVKMNSAYKLEKYNSSSLLHEIYKIDDGELFAQLMKYDVNEHLTNKEDFLQEGDIEDKDKDKDYTTLDQVDCTKRILTKVYYSLEEMKADKNKEDLLYDPELDFTNYKLLDKYKPEKKGKNKEDFLQFLQTQLIFKHNCPSRIAKDTAETMIRGTKFVQEGEYAKLIVYPKLPLSNDDEAQLSDHVKKEIAIEKNVRKQETFYIRSKNTWVHDSNVDELSFVDSTFLFCNINDKCYQKDSNSTCENIEIDARDRLKRQARTDMKQELLSRFDKHVGESKEKIEMEMIQMHERIVKVRQIMDLRNLSANNYSYNLGKVSLTNTEKPVSPYWKMRDDLFHHSINFSRKQGLITDFYKSYCREPVLTEQVGWKYCVVSNSPLLESSLYTLAEAFQSGTYLKTLDMLCKKQGVLSDDGDKVMDRESGCELTKIEYTEDGKNIFALDDEKDATINDQNMRETKSTIDVQQLKQLKTKNNESNYKEKDLLKIYEYFKAFCAATYVPIDEIENDVMQLCNSLFKKPQVIMTDKVYQNLIIQHNTKVGKEEKTAKTTMATWEEYVESRKMEVLGAVILTVIQLKTPSFQTKKYERSCTYSFEGYPLDNSHQNGIDYISCVFKLLWKSQKKLISPNLGKNMKILIDKFILPLEDIQHKFKLKRDFLATDPFQATQIPEEFTIWSRFLPPLVQIVVLSGNMTFVKPEFHTNLQNSIKDGDAKQWELSSTYGVKLQFFVCGFVEMIQNILQKKETLLNTISKVPFQQNACCNENENKNLTPIQYFGIENPQVGVFLKTMFTISRLLDDFRRDYKTAFLHAVSANNTKITETIIPTLYQNVDEHVMLKTMIFYCRYDYDNQVLPNDLIDICKAKPTTYDPLSSFPEKKENLQETGIRMNQTLFSQMMSKIHQRNMMKPKINLDVTWNSQSSAALNQLSDKLKDVFTDNTVMDAFKTVVEEEIPSDKTKENLNNVLNKVNIQWLKETKEFMGAHCKTMSKTRSTKLISDFFSTLVEKNTEMSLDRLNYYVMSYVKHISCIFPLYIGTKRLNSAKRFSSHWNLTPEDQVEYQKFNTNKNKELNTLKGDTCNAVLSPILTRVEADLQPIMYLFHSIIQLFPHHLPENKPLIHRCYTFLILLVFKTFIAYSENKEIIMETAKSSNSSDDVDDEYQIYESRLTLQDALGSLFLFYFQYDIQNVHFMSYADIIKLVDKGKEIEKQKVKKYYAKLQNQSVDLLKAELSMKRLNLGNYFINQNDLITYGKKVDNFYDENLVDATDPDLDPTDPTDPDPEDLDPDDDDVEEEEEQERYVDEDDDMQDIYSHGNDN